MKVTIHRAGLPDSKEVELLPSDGFYEVALKVGCIMKPSLSGVTHVMINGKDQECGDKPQDGDHILLAYECFSSLERQYEAEREKKKEEDIVRYLTQFPQHYPTEEKRMAKARSMLRLEE